MGIPVTQLHCAPCGLARGQSLDQTRKCKMGPKLFQKYIQISALIKLNYYTQFICLNNVINKKVENRKKLRSLY